MKKSFIASFAFILAAGASQAALANSEPPQVIADGLELVKRAGGSIDTMFAANSVSAWSEVSAGPVRLAQELPGSEGTLTSFLGFFQRLAQT